MAIADTGGVHALSWHTYLNPKAAEHDAWNKFQGLGALKKAQVIGITILASFLTLGIATVLAFRLWTYKVDREVNPGEVASRRASKTEEGRSSPLPAEGEEGTTGTAPVNHAQARGEVEENDGEEGARVSLPVVGDGRRSPLSVREEEEFGQVSSSSSSSEGAAEGGYLSTPHSPRVLEEDPKTTPVSQSSVMSAEVSTPRFAVPLALHGLKKEEETRLHRPPTPIVPLVQREAGEKKRRAVVRVDFLDEESRPNPVVHAWTPPESPQLSPTAQRQLEHVAPEALYSAGAIQRAQEKYRSRDAMITARAAEDATTLLRVPGDSYGGYVDSKEHKRATFLDHRPLASMGGQQERQDRGNVVATWQTQSLPHVPQEPMIPPSSRPFASVPSSSTSRNPHLQTGLHATGRDVVVNGSFPQQRVRPPIHSQTQRVADPRLQQLYQGAVSQQLPSYGGGASLQGARIVPFPGGYGNSYPAGGRYAAGGGYYWG